MLKTESLPSVANDNRSMSSQGVGVISGGGGGGGKVHNTKFSYSVECLRAFKKVIHFVENGIYTERVQSAGHLYRPNAHEVTILQFPVIYKDFMSMRRSNTDPSLYLRKKINDHAHGVEALDVDFGKKKGRKDPSIEKVKAHKIASKVKATSPDKEMHSGTSVKLPTIFELTSAGSTPLKKTRPKAHLLKG